MIFTLSIRRPTQFEETRVGMKKFGASEAKERATCQVATEPAEF